MNCMHRIGLELMLYQALTASLLLLRPLSEGAACLPTVGRWADSLHRWPDTIVTYSTSADWAILSPFIRHI